MVMGLGVMGSGAVGWLMGPFLGDAVFGIRYRALRGEMAEVSGVFLGWVGVWE